MVITRSRAPRRLAAAASLAATLAAAVAGCGSSPGAGDTDPATVVPAGAPLYIEAVVRPEGAQRENAEAVLRKVLRTDDPGAEIAKLIDRSARDDGLSFKEDIDPWLGGRIGVAVTSFRGSEAHAVVVAASKDNDKAEEALSKGWKTKPEERSYKDVAYRYDRSNRTAAALVGDSVVVGTESGLKSAIDASKGSSLGDAGNLEKARSIVAADRLGFVYMDVERFLREVAAADRSGQAGGILQALSGELPRTLAAAVQADPDAVRVDSAQVGGPAQPPAGAQGADALAALPPDSWLGVGMGDVGGSVDRLLARIVSAGGLGASALQALLRQAEAETGLDIERDLLAWMGDAGLFVAGTSALDVRGGLIVHSRDPAATRRAIRRIARLVASTGANQVTRLRAPGVDVGFRVAGRGSGPDLLFAAGGKRFVLAVGRRALTEGLRGSGRLRSSPALAGAAGKLGGGVPPSLFLDMQRLTQLIGAVAGSDADFRRARPYLEAFSAVAAGGRRDGDIARGRLVVTLR